MDGEVEEGVQQDEMISEALKPGVFNRRMSAEVKKKKKSMIVYSCVF